MPPESSTPQAGQRPSPSRRRLGSLADQIYDHLRTSIIHGTLPPGAKIVELTIAEEMGTSQGPVREALGRLERDGLVEKQARSSTYVTDISVDEIFEFFSIRSMVEGFAVRRATARIKPDQIKELEDLVNKMHEAGKRSDMHKLVEYDMIFHRRLCEWSGSRVLINTWKPLYSQIQRFIVQNHKQFFPNLEDLAATHDPLIAALKAGDAEAASRLVEEHIMLVWSQMQGAETSIGNHNAQNTGL